MKLSEAMRAGAKIRPQAFGGLYKMAFRWLRFEKRSCALGAAYEGGDCQFKVEPATHAFLGRDGKLIAAGETRNFVQIPDEWTAVLTFLAECPQCEMRGSVQDVIPHLNDNHKWRRTEIARWIERVEYAVLWEQRAQTAMVMPTQDEVLDAAEIG